MAMPEAAMHKNGSPEFWQKQIRSSWNIPCVESVAKSVFVQQLADEHFRFCIARPYCAHVA